MTDTLRPYQVEVIAEIEAAIAAGNKRIIVVAPTGSGKTIIGGELIDRFARSYRPAVVIAHRLEIITQTSRKLYDRNIRTASSRPASSHGRWSACSAPRCRPCGRARCARRRCRCRRPIC